MKKLHTLLLALLVAAVAAQAQERTITGTILDGEFQGEPLIGATIAVGDGKTRVGTVTDLNGHFSLTLLASIKKVTVSYMGYEPRTITLKPNQTKYDITLFSFPHPRDSARSSSPAISRLTGASSPPPSPR